MEHWEYLKPDGLRFVWDDTLFRPGTDSFLLSSLPKLSAGLLTFQCIDLRQVRQHFSTGSFDLVVCNPPYYPPASGKVSGDSARRTARSETEASLADICAAASYLLRWGGKFCLVHKPERLTDTACALREAGMDPKRLRFVQNRPDTAPSLFLIEGCRGGKPGVDIQPPLLLQTDTGAPTGELNVIYFRDQEV